MQFFLILTLVIFRRDIRKKKGIFIQVPTVLMARFGLFGSRFLISWGGGGGGGGGVLVYSVFGSLSRPPSPPPPPPPQKNVHIMVLILDILESVRTIRHPGLTLL